MLHVKEEADLGGNDEKNGTARVSVRHIRPGTKNYYSPEKYMDVAINYKDSEVKRQGTLITVGFKTFSRKNNPSLLAIHLKYEEPRWRRE